MSSAAGTAADPRMDTGAPNADRGLPAGVTNSPAAPARARRVFASPDLRLVAIILACLLVLGGATLGLIIVRGWHSANARLRASAAALAAVSRLQLDTGALFAAGQESLGAGEQKSRVDWQSARQRVANDIDSLQALTADQPAQQQRLAELRRSLDEGSQQVDASTPAGALPAAENPRAVAVHEQRYDVERRLLDALQQTQYELWATQLAAADRQIDRTFIIADLRTLFSVALIALVSVLVWRDNKARGVLAMERAAAIAEAESARRRVAAERRQSEHALRNRDMMLRGMADAIPQMVFVLFRDGTGEFLNRRWHDYTGVSPVFRRDEGLVMVHPDDVAQVRATWRYAVTHDAPFEVEFRLRGKDGTHRWFLAQSAPAPLADDDVAHWVGALTDIDDIRRADTALRESEDRFRRIFEGSPFGITLSRGERRCILQANPAFCQMLGYARDELIGRSLIDLTHPDERTSEGAFPRLAGVGPGWRTREKRYLTRQGTVVWARIRVSVFDSPRGGEPRMLAVAEDITRQRELDGALRQAQRMEAVGQLSGGVAHDFNNLLGVIIGNIECLLETLDGDAGRRELAQEVLDSALSGAELTRRLLAFGRRQSLSPRQIDLSEQAAQQVTLLRRTLGRSIQVETVLAGDLWPTRADPSQLGDALLNLAINARDAMPHGGMLTIETHNDRVPPGGVNGEADIAPGDYAVLSVSDTGIGMPPEVRARAVEPFFTTKPAGAGSGLGLSMIYGFVSQSGGHLTIASEIGIGTTVSIYLPHADGPLTPMELESHATAMPAGHETILVVDDSAEMRQVAERHLRFLGYTVLTAESGPAALALLRSGTPVDLLFTDIAMPEGLNGFQLAAAAVGLRAGLKVLFTTGYAGARSPDGSPDWQDRLIRKPYRRAELAEKIRATLGTQP